MTAKTTRQDTRRGLSRAFSLAELMVALGILGIGLLMVAAAFPVAIDQVRQGVELQTSQLVFEEAVTKLKTQITLAELRGYMAISNEDGAYEGRYQLSVGADDITNVTARRNALAALPLLKRPVFLLSFDAVRLDDGSDNPASGNPLENSCNQISGLTLTHDWFANFGSGHCVYSSDATYGWAVAAQALNDTAYKFWVFVIRDPSGMDVIDGGATKLKYQVVMRSLSPDRIEANDAPSGDAVTSRFMLGQLLRTAASPRPRRNLFFLSDVGGVNQLKNVLNVADDADKKNDPKNYLRSCICNENNWDATGLANVTGADQNELRRNQWALVFSNAHNVVRRIAYVGTNPDVAAAISSGRADPTVAVYETVIDYSALQ